MNSAGVIRNIGQEYDAALVEKPAMASLLQGRPEEPVWKACETDGKVYIEARMTRIRELEPWFKDGAFSQLPHKNFERITLPGEVCYYCDKSIRTEKPAGAVDTTVAVSSQSRYLFYTVYPATYSKNTHIYEPLWLQERPNPHRVYTVPLSWLAAVAVDIPGSVVATVVSLPFEIYSVISAVISD
jgi:hypothetical protein